MVGALSLTLAKKSEAIFLTNEANHLSQRPQRRGRRYVHRGAVAPRLRWNLRALGDRVEHPGKEQQNISGTLELAKAPHPASIVINNEFPDRMALTLQTGVDRRAITFDGTQESWTALSEDDRDLVETLLFDGPDHFFYSQTNGAATRFLGARFSETADGTTGPFYDIYAVTPSPSLTQTSAQGAKLFQFNSDNHLLELVRYTTERNGSRLAVEVRLSDWREIAGQRIPHRIERLENGVKVMTLSINTVWFAPGGGGRAD
jgi:hypothetical protein